MGKKILITKNLSNHSVIKTWCELQSDYQLIAESQLKIEFCTATLPTIDWVFFSSKNAVEGYFLNGGSKKPKFAVIGQATSKALETKGCSASFIGEGNDTVNIALKFQEVLADQKVLFPVGNLSKRNMAEFIDEKQVQFNVVYDSILNSTDYPTQFDIIVFTSPSNVDSFLLKNNLNESQVIIAIGKTTAGHLKAINPGLNITIPNSFSEEAILESIQISL